MSVRKEQSGTEELKEGTCEDFYKAVIFSFLLLKQSPFWPVMSLGLVKCSQLAFCTLSNSPVSEEQEHVRVADSSHAAWAEQTAPVWLFWDSDMKSASFPYKI